MTATAANPSIGSTTRLRKLRDSRVDTCVTIVGKWGRFINGKSYQQDAIATHNGTQYVTYYNAERRVCIARRRLPAGEWEHIRFNDYRFEGDDNHNVTVLGICPRDGTLHLAFDHHGRDLHYRASRPGVATNPGAAPWAADLFGPVQSELRPGHAVERVTYPHFATTPSGTLLLVWRNGRAKDGRIMLCEYDPGASPAGWNDPWQVTDSTVPYAYGDRTSASRNAYLNGAHFDYPRNRLHLSWAWREDFAVSTNCGIAYAVSDDVGRTWRNSAGELIGRAGQPIRVDSPGVLVWDVGPEWGLDNQDGQSVDGLGRPHVLVWHLRAPNPAEQNRDPSLSRYYHYWRDTTGTWRRNELPHLIEAEQDRVHPKAIAAPNGDVYCLFNYEGRIVVCAATAGRHYQDWRIMHEEPGPWDGAPLPDLYRWRDEGILSIYMQREPAQDGAPTDLHVLDFELVTAA